VFKNKITVLKQNEKKTSRSYLELIEGASGHELHHSVDELDSYQLKYHHFYAPSWWQAVAA